MKRSLRKITYREIRSSLGRFLAILCIVMLGAGFLAGLKVTRKAMLKTLNSYNAESRFFDFRMISTLGLTEDDVSYFASLPGVETAEGATETDALFEMPDDMESVLKVHSIPKSINTPLLRSGRLPQAENECVLDAFYFGEDVIGKTITLSERNDSQRLDLFGEPGGDTFVGRRHEFADPLF